MKGIFIIFILNALCLFSCISNNKKGTSVDNIKEVVYSISIETEIEKEPPFEEYLNPLYSFANLSSEIDVGEYLSVKKTYNSLNDSLIVNDSLGVRTKYGNVIFNNNQFNCNAFHYQGKDDKLNLYVIGVEYDEFYNTILLNGDSLQSFSLSGNIYISPNKKYLITANNYSDPIYHGYYELYSIDRNKFNIAYLTTIWSNEQYEDILWNNDDIFVKTDNNKYYVLNINQVIEKSNLLQKENNIFSKDKNWFDIFYFSPFDENSGITGTYYIQIKDKGESEFVTSFNSQDVDFNYKVIPYYNDGILYLLNKDMPETLAKIVKVGESYYIDSEFIKVYSDEIARTKYGYRLNKGFPED